MAGHGGWLPWLEREFGWKEQTARNYMLAYEWAAKSPTVGDLNVDMRSLYLLAAPSTPEPARTEVIERAEAGEHFTHAQIKDLATMGSTKHPISAVTILFITDRAITPQFGASMSSYVIIYHPMSSYIPTYLDIFRHTNPPKPHQKQTYFAHGLRVVATPKFVRGCFCHCKREQLFHRNTGNDCNAERGVRAHSYST
jgi:hypothetical protein